jgi:hypothetical protein
MTTELEGLVTEARERQLKFAFHVSHREILNCEANWALLDGYLTDHQKPFTADFLEEAYAALEGQLAKRNLTIQPQPQQTQQVALTPVAEVATGPDASIPKEFTRKVILKMDAAEYKPFLKKYGAFAVQHRVNKIEQAKEQ